MHIYVLKKKEELIFDYICKLYIYIYIYIYFGEICENSTFVNFTFFEY